MKLKDIFKDIFKGFDLEKEGKYEPFKAYLIDSKDVENCRIGYDESNIREISMKYRDKYFLQHGDVIIATRPSLNTCHVGYYSTNIKSSLKIKPTPNSFKVVPKKNFIILRDCNLDLYEPEFIANYLEYIGINKFFENKEKDVSLKLEDVEDLEIPLVSMEEQKDLIKLFNPVNERAFLYKKMIKNDIEISKYALNKVINNEE